MEFHEEVGLGSYQYTPSAPQYDCAVCGEIFPNNDALLQHRFENHPSHLPTLMLRGRACGTRAVVITSKFEPADVHVERCDQATLNGQLIPVQALGHTLAKQTTGTCHVVLRSVDAASEYTLEFRIASENDLCGVENEFERIAARKRLDMRTVEELIEATEKYATASRYSDGICTYLHGVLAKERTANCPLPYTEYEAKFTRSVAELRSYDRPLARAIVSVIEFHHNHFREATQSGRCSRIEIAARKFLRWLHWDGGGTSTHSETQLSNIAFERWVTERETEEIVRWTMCSPRTLARQATALEAFVKRDVADFDRVKVRILLSELYAATGNATRAIYHAKSLQNLQGFEDWATRKIRAFSE